MKMVSYHYFGECRIGSKVLSFDGVATTDIAPKDPQFYDELKKAIAKTSEISHDHDRLTIKSLTRIS